MTKKDRVKIGLIAVCLVAAAVLLAWQFGLFDPAPPQASNLDQPVNPELDEQPTSRGNIRLPPKPR